MHSRLSPHYHPSTGPRDFGELILASGRLWLASLRFIWREALLASFLPVLPLLLWWWSKRSRFDGAVPEAWLDPGLWQFDAFGLVLTLTTNILGLGFWLIIMQRQGLLARGLGDQIQGAESAWRHLPQALVASVSYTVLMLLALAPVGVAAWFGSVGEEPILALLYLLIGLLLATVPLTWVSIAAVFIYPPILLDRCGGLAAQKWSFRLVRGHWVRCAGLLSLTMFTSLGLLGTVGALPFALTGIAAFAEAGPDALLRPGWLVFGQLLSTPFAAVCLPLATAGYMVCYEDLRWRQPGMINPESTGPTG